MELTGANSEVAQAAASPTPPPGPAPMSLFEACKELSGDMPPARKTPKTNSARQKDFVSPVHATATTVPEVSPGEKLELGGDSVAGLPTEKVEDVVRMGDIVAG